MKTAAVIVAAGRGSRMGGVIPKQFLPLAGQTVLWHAVMAFARHPKIEHIVIVHAPNDAQRSRAALAGVPGEIVFVPGGAERHSSVRLGLAEVAANYTHVLVHDGARPLVSPEVISNVYNALKDAPAAAPGLTVVDTLWRGTAAGAAGAGAAETASGAHVVGEADRRNLWRAQTPQGFRRDILVSAHAAHAATQAAPETGQSEAEISATDDVAVVRRQGIDVAIVPGATENFKITWPGDILRAENILNPGETTAEIMGANPHEPTVSKGKNMDIRTGNGFDVHRFGTRDDGKNDHVVLCGVAVPHTRGLLGHSDADVGMHAITDAIYGALAEGDIGRHFPPSDPQWKNAESHIFLAHAVSRARARGFEIKNIDCTLICEHPKIGPHAAKMQARLAQITGIDPARISVKATTSEQLGFTGRGEGIAAQATTTVLNPRP